MRRCRWAVRLLVIGVAFASSLVALGTVAPVPPSRADATPTIPLLTGGILHFAGNSSTTIDETSSDPAYPHYQETMSGLAFSADYLLMGDYDISGYQTPKSNWPGNLAGNVNPPLSWQSTAGSDSNSGSDNGTCSGTLTWGEPQPTSFGDRIPGYDRATDQLSGVGTTIVATTGGCTSPDGPGPMAGGAQPFLAANGVFSFPVTPYQGTSLSRPFSNTVTYPYSAGTGGQTETAAGTMTLTCALCVSNIVFKQLVDPTAGDQMQQLPSNTTFDGNVVEVSATIQNTTDLDLTSDVSFADNWATVHEAQGTHLIEPVSFPAHSTQTVTESIDTSGMAWYGTTPESQQTIRVETAFGGAQRDLTMLPKPVVLVHGWNADATTWDAMKDLLAAKDPQWPVFAVGDSWAQPGETMDTDPATGQWISGNAAAEGRYIEHIRSMTGAQHVDLVVHSMGGLISRYYIDRLMLDQQHPPGGRHLVSHLVMLGTPNQGSSCAELVAAPAVIAGGGRPTLQLTSAYVGILFDHTITHQHGVPFSVIAGTGIPTCVPALNGDIVVTKTSAWWNYADVGTAPFDLHTTLPHDPAIVDGWIMPHIAVMTDAYWSAGGTPLRASARTVRRPAARTTAAAVPAVVAAAKGTVAAGATWTTPAQVEAGASRLAVTTVADPSVRIQLVRPDGHVAVTQAADSPHAADPFRIVTVDRPTAGRWTVRFTDTGATRSAVLTSTAELGAPTTARAAVTRLPGHRLRLTLTLRRSGSPVTGAAAQGYLRSDTGALVTARLHDDGTGGDAHAHDGVYTADTGSLAPGGYTIVLRATKASLTRVVTTGGTA